MTLSDTAILTTRESGPAGQRQVQFSVGGSPEHVECERQLISRGVAIPFASRSDVCAMREFSPALFVAVRRGTVCEGGFVLRSRPAPYLAGHYISWVEQFGSSIPMEAAGAVVSGLLERAQQHPRLLRLSVDNFSFDESRRAALGRVLLDHGFRRAVQPSNYAETLVIDLGRSEEELFASLHHSARRKIRQVDRHPLAIRTVDDPACGDRMNSLLQQTFARTGGHIEDRDWSSRIQLSRRNPDLSRIIGLFRTDVTGPEALIAFAWGCHGGDHVFYSEAASTRDTGETKVAVAYGLMWDLILWAKRTGARVFDMGGVTRGTHTGEDPLGGISDFKRYFSQKIVAVRDEWILDHHTWRASIASAVHRRLRR